VKNNAMVVYTTTGSSGCTLVAASGAGKGSHYFLSLARFCSLFASVLGSVQTTLEILGTAWARQTAVLTTETVLQDFLGSFASDSLQVLVCTNYRL
jgi:hypothetical protein